MTVVAVLIDPPREGLALPALAETTPLSRADAATLYAAMARDVLCAVEASAGELLVNYRPDDSLPANDGRAGDTGDAETEIRALAEAALDQPDEARFEVQVGSTFAGRVGNTLTHLLRDETVSSAAVVSPTAPFLTRGDLDGMAMKLRRSDAVLGPAADGRVHSTWFSSPVDFAEAYAPPAIGTLTDRALDADLDVDYGPMHPVVETHDDLVDAMALIGARRRAGRTVPEHTTACLDELGVVLAESDGALSISGPDTDSD